MRPNDQPDYLPISMLNQLEYCSRRFWLMFVQGEMEINAPVLDGTLRHERAHESGQEREGDTVRQRRVYVYSDVWRLTGFIDVMEESGGELYPVEYKRGRMGRWLPVLARERSHPTLRPGPVPGRAYRQSH